MTRRFTIRMMCVAFVLALCSCTGLRDQDTRSSIRHPNPYTRAIEFKGPAYLPCTIGANLDWLYDKDEGKRERVRELAARFPNDILYWVAPKDFGTFNGGYIGGTSHSVMPETPLDNVIAMYEAFAEYHTPSTRAHVVTTSSCGTGKG